MYAPIPIPSKNNTRCAGCLFERITPIIGSEKATPTKTFLLIVMYSFFFFIQILQTTKYKMGSVKCRK